MTRTQRSYAMIRLAKAILMLVLIGSGYVYVYVSVYADIAGRFETQFTLIPLPCPDPVCEATPFLIRWTSQFQLVFASRALLLGIDSSFGPAGPEFLILTSQLAWGVTLENMLVFAAPFGQARIATGERVAVAIPPGDALFVRQQALWSYSWDGLTLGSQLIFEDVTFPSPLASPRAKYSAIDQRFAFGTSFMLEGRARGGTRLKSITGFCLDASRRRNILRRSFPGRVCEAGQMEFTHGKFLIEDLPWLSTLWSDHELDCRPRPRGPSPECLLESEFDVHTPYGKLTISTDLDLNRLLSGTGLQEVEGRWTADPWTMTASWNGLLRLKRIKATLDLVFGSQEPLLQWKLSTTFTPDSRLTRLESILSLERGPLEFKLTTTISSSNGRLQLEENHFSWIFGVRSLTLELQALFRWDGLREATVALSLQF